VDTVISSKTNPLIPLLPGDVGLWNLIPIILSSQFTHLQNIQ
jgi:hypothetical protein